MTAPVPGVLAGLIAHVVGVDESLVTRDAAFADLGRSSADEVELLVAIEDYYRITLDFGAYVDLATVGDLADAVEAAARGAQATAAG